MYLILDLYSLKVRGVTWMPSISCNINISLSCYVYFLFISLKAIQLFKFKFTSSFQCQTINEITLEALGDSLMINMHTSDKEKTSMLLFFSLDAVTVLFNATFGLNITSFDLNMTQSKEYKDLENMIHGAVRLGTILFCLFFFNYYSKHLDYYPWS